MEGDSTTIIDSTFSINEQVQSLECLKQVVDIHLRSSNESWINKFKNDTTEAYSNIKDSKIGILPDLITTLYFSAKNLDENASNNSMINKGIEVVSNAINSYISSISESKFEFSESSFEKEIKSWVEDGTFIPKSRAKKLIFDTVTICNFMLRNNI